MPDTTTISIHHDDMDRFKEFKESEYGKLHDGVPHRVALNRLIDIWKLHEQ